MDSNALANPGGRVSTFDGLEARKLATVDITLTDMLRGRSKPYTRQRVGEPHDALCLLGKAGRLAANSSPPKGGRSHVDA